MVNKHYLNKYNKFISHYKRNLTEGYCEKHHIIPKCMGGTDDIENLVLLPARAHIIAHELLMKSYPDSRKLKHAFAAMALMENDSQCRRYSSRQYELAKIARSEALKNVPRPEYVKEKLRVKKPYTANYKKPKSKRHALNISKALKGYKKTKEHISKITESSKLTIKNKTEKKIQHYRSLFVNSNLSRKEFYETHTEKSISTLKRYLKGL
jgi:hypothetical protein